LDSEQVSADVLKVGHHGSKTSTDEYFVGWVDPMYAVISAGCDNRYGHPHQEVIETLNRFNVEILQTCDAGTIVFESDGKILRGDATIPRNAVIIRD
jgi:competence protein ComEC